MSTYSFTANPLGRAAGYPDYSSAAAGNYTPQLYAQKTLVKFYKSTFLKEIANTDYEGMIKAQGDKVIIRTVPDITVNDYVIGQDIDYATYDSPSITLEINKAKYYAFKIDNITQLQNDIDQMAKWTDDAAERMKIAIETGVFADIYATNYATNVSAYNRGATAGLESSAYPLGVAGGTSLKISAAASNSTTSTNVVDAIMRAEAVLTEQNVPQDGNRWIIIPTWMGYKFRTGDLRRQDSNGPAGQELLRNGKIGMIGQFNIYVSNNLPKAANGTDFYIPFGHKTGLTFATQMTNTETMPHPTAFGKILRSLQVYGYKVVKPESMGMIFGAALAE